MSAKRRRSAGLTLVELMIAIAILGVLVAVGAPSYAAYLERGRIALARADIVALDLAIARYEVSANGLMPDSLAQIGGAPLDPWGNPYRYLNLRNAKNHGHARKDHNLVPINSDYDLYSMGPDGASVPPLTARKSRDDIIRARNGRFIGKATDF